MQWDTRRFALAGGIFWGVILFLTTLVSVYTGYARAFLTGIASIYPGYSISLLGSVVGLVYGFLDVLTVAAKFLCSGVKSSRLKRSLRLTFPPPLSAWDFALLMQRRDYTETKRIICL
jgi:hypothetical protein